ncbi:Oidioi.mRNA.OKI2018_I69.chr1.g2917.t1.cds [Oikopleura dioica]|uniref:Oidioi.mRNA.OKI2018_I69.chr1.g2917.t1.cds n=1 Tax=Oikopleura dioica TaxID=34765 RepID=A0ABN7SZF4_OIKDI|nr:Oidioi.mRNA.OKI2018_I69.chr1.g2917.t1.cds [Oikopleura dioica]
MINWACLPDWLRSIVPCHEDENERAIRKRNEEIDKALRKEKSRLRKQVRILLLGTGESGKSTFLKQMRIVHADGFTTLERSMKVLIDALESFAITLEKESNANYKAKIQDWDKSKELNPATFSNYSSGLLELWADKAIQEVFSMRSQFQLGESIRYYMAEENIERIMQHDYHPNSSDILWARRRTDVVSETEVTIKKVPFAFIDVGGQRTQRQKWFQCFQNSINTVLFFVAVSEFDQTLVEDKNTNRVIESLKVFKYILEQKAFRDRDIIIFFNKCDLLEEKIKEGIKVTDYFATPFKGDPLNVKDVQNFFRDLFYATAQCRLETPDEQGNFRDDLGLYHHFTVAIDTENIKKVFEAVKDMEQGFTISTIFYPYTGIFFIRSCVKINEPLSVLKENMAQLMLE